MHVIRGSRRRTRAVTALLVAGGLAGAAALTANDPAADRATPVHLQRLTSLGATTFTAGPVTAAVRHASSTAAGAATELNWNTMTEPRVPRNARSRSGKAPSGPATVTPNSTVTSASSGFDGLTHYDQRTANGGNQFSLEPPDQALCIGGGQVLESVNDVMTVYSTSGRQLTSVQDLNSFFGLPAQVVRNRDGSIGDVGDFLSDPKCLYDGDTHRWFLTVLQEDPQPDVTVPVRTHTLIAVSNSSDATGKWHRFSIDTTDDGKNGTPKNTDCPCLGDQPLIGADAHGFYISNNEFPELVNGFNGAQVYAMSKAALVKNTSGRLPAVAHLDLGKVATPDPGGIWYSVQPAAVPEGGSYYNSSTELFLSALQFGPSNFDNRIAVWAMTGTDTLDARRPFVSMQVKVLNSETYGMPSKLQQKDTGSLRPLGTLLHEPAELLDTNDDRMNQVVYAQGHLWAALNTTVNNGKGGAPGVAWFVVDPTVSGREVSADMHSQGYVALSGSGGVAYPAIGVNNAGDAVMGFTVSSTTMYPSVGYVPMTADGLTGAVQISAVGQAPEDGFTGYRAYGGTGVARWGDYSAAVADSNGDIWLAQEYIPGGQRTELANWGTFITHVAR